jgi:hypothetical protein
VLGLTVSTLSVCYVYIIIYNIYSNNSFESFRLHTLTCISLHVNLQYMIVTLATRPVFYRILKVTYLQ